MKYSVQLGERTFEFEATTDDGRLRVMASGDEVAHDWQPLDGSNLFSLLHRGNSYMFHIERVGGRYRVTYSGKSTDVLVEDERARILREVIPRGAESASRDSVKAPMPGLVLSVPIEVNQVVEQGKPLVIIEAMKMENEIRAAHRGVVKEVLVKERDAVEKGQELVVLEEAE